MQVVLLERVEKLGQMGDVVKVKPGFARNFLLPRGKALRATKVNIARFEREKAQLEARNLELRREAEGVSVKLDGKIFNVMRQAGETGQLYGSVNTRDISDAVTAGGFTVNRSQIILDKPIKDLGLHALKVQLHPEVRVKVTINVARNEDEAARQARGEKIVVKDDEAAIDAAELLEAEAAEALAEAEAEAGSEVKGEGEAA